jgi:hypothetical protein
MPKGSSVDKAERALRSEARKKGLTGEQADRYVFGSLNNKGLMHGNKATTKGKAGMRKK